MENMGWTSWSWERFHPQPLLLSLAMDSRETEVWCPRWASAPVCRTWVWGRDWLDHQQVVQYTRQDQRCLNIWKTVENHLFLKVWLWTLPLLTCWLTDHDLLVPELLTQLKTKCSVYRCTLYTLWNISIKEFWTCIELITYMQKLINFLPLLILSDGGNLGIYQSR